MFEYCDLIKEKCIFCSKSKNITYCSVALKMSERKTWENLDVVVEKLKECPIKEKEKRKTLKRNRSGFSKHREKEGYFQ